ncbi:MAG: UTP--glucose-1-phosphate uridylyltransferase [Tepidisphaeraceae bacterium]
MSTPQRITKAIIPAAGFGTRMLPAAKAVPKELLPVLDRPTIQYVVEEAADAGLDDVLLITSRDKRAIEDHFDRAFELEMRLAAGKKDALLASVTKLASRIQVHAVRQAEQLGLGHAVLQAEHHVGDSPCLCLLGDTIFSGSPAPATQLVEAHAKLGGTIIALEEVPAEKVDRYGIAGGMMIEPGVMKITDLIEKPCVDLAPSRFAICARYVLAPQVFDFLKRTPRGKGNEIQLTDALKLMLQAGEPMHGVVLKARRHDIGNPVDWLATNVLFASRDGAMWSKLAPLIKSLVS